MTLSKKYRRIKSRKDSAMEIDIFDGGASTRRTSKRQLDNPPTAVDILESQMKKIVIEPTMLVKRETTKRKDRMSAMGIPKKIHKAELINTNLLLT